MTLGRLSGRTRGFTLMELLVTLVILAILAGTVVGMVDGAADQGRDACTRASLEALSRAITGADGAPGFHADLGRLPTRTAELLAAPRSYDPVSRRGWRGPYAHVAVALFDLASLAPPSRHFTSLDGAASPYGAQGEPAVLDGWGRPIVLQIPDLDVFAPPSPLELRHARLVSAGPDGVLDTSALALLPSRHSCGDDLVRFVLIADERP